MLKSLYRRWFTRNKKFTVEDIYRRLKSQTFRFKNKKQMKDIGDKLIYLALNKRITGFEVDYNGEFTVEHFVRKFNEHYSDELEVCNTADEKDFIIDFLEKFIGSTNEAIIKQEVKFLFCSTAKDYFEKQVIYPMDRMHNEIYELLQLKLLPNVVPEEDKPQLKDVIELVKGSLIYLVDSTLHYSPAKGKMINDELQPSLYTRDTLSAILAYVKGTRSNPFKGSKLFVEKDVEDYFRYIDNYQTFRAKYTKII